MVQIGRGDPLSSRGGSFGAPKGDKFLEEVLAGRKAPKEAPPEEEDEEGEVPAEQPSDKTERKTVSGALDTAFDRALLQEAESIGLKITDDDLMEFVFNSYIAKEVPIIKGKLHALFRTTTGEDLSFVNQEIGKLIKQDADMMQKEFQNINTLYLFSCVLLKMGKPGALNTLPKDPKEKIAQLNKMSPLILNKLSKRYNLLEYLLNKKLEEEDVIKN